MRSTRRTITIAIVAAGALALGNLAGPAGAATGTPATNAPTPPSPQTTQTTQTTSSAPRAVSGRTPFSGCTAGGTPSSTLFAGAEVEPWIAVNPRDPRNIVAYYQQDRWSDGGARGLVASVTRDGGAHWKQVVVPGLSQCSGGTFERASDPGLSFAPNGDLYEISLSFNVSDFGNAILASKSTDGGLHWSRPAILKSDTAEALQNDKELITADPTSSQRVYAVWDRTNEEGGQPVWFARTINGGRGWEPAKIIYDPTPRFTISNQIVVQPDGTLIDVFFEGPAGAAEEPEHPFARPHPTATPLQGDEDNLIRIIRSTDHGRTWSAPITVARIDPADIVEPDGRRPLRTADIVPDIAVDRHTGRLYIVWQDGRFTQSGAAIMLTSSGDGGRTWTAPVRVSKTPDSAPQGNGQAFTPMVDVAERGRIGVTYYDFRRDTAAPGALTDYWIVTCDGPRCIRDGAPWRERHVGGSFDVTLAPDAGGLFLGDYMGLDHAGSTFRSVFSMTRPIEANQQDEFVAAIR
ncbi:MAG TPA: sialidase family protein [Streptosporangiaceae bacterium]|nr:sialidase family protein [Streptosporangiaceae bacterium]